MYHRKLLMNCLINTSVMSCRKSIIVEPSTRERARNSVRKNNYKSQREREPSRVCDKKLHKMFHSKCSHKRLRCAINANFPESPFIRKIIMNYKYYQMMYLISFIACMFFSLLMSEKKRRLLQFREKILYPKVIT